MKHRNYKDFKKNFVHIHKERVPDRVVHCTEETPFLFSLAISSITS
jgi:hypothetical protein